MFKDSINLTNKTLISKQRAKEIKKQLQRHLDQETIDELFKDNIMSCKSKECKTEFLIINDQVKFFYHYQQILPTLKFLHKNLNFLKIVKVDEGAVKHVINGSDIFIPGIVL